MAVIYLFSNLVTPNDFFLIHTPGYVPPPLPAFDAYDTGVLQNLFPSPSNKPNALN